MTERINDPGLPDYDPLLPTVLENGFTPVPGDKKTEQMRIADEKKADFLVLYGRFANASFAAKAVGWSTKMAYKHRDSDPKFKEAWENVVRGEALGHVEANAFDIAINGIKEPVFNKDGVEVGEKVKQSDSMIQFLLKKWKPEVYGDKIDHNVTVDAGVLVVPGMASEGDWEDQAKVQQLEHRGSNKRIEG